MAALVGRDGRVCGIDISEDVARVSARIGSNPLYLSKSDKVVTVSHHLAHAYSAFAACPFNEGVVMVVDGVGNYNSDVTEPGQLTDNVNPLADQRGAVAAHASADPRSGGMAEAGRPRLF
jgi:predicted NodU family carbamoyl transferase